MFRRYWIAGIAFGLIFIGLVGWGLTSSSRYYVQNRDIQGAATNQYTRYTRAEEICSPIEPLTARLSCLIERVDTNHDQQHAEADLQAQLDMSSWTYAILWIGIVGVVVSTGGIALIFETLRETRAMADATRKSVQITQDARDRQLRAYISFSCTEIKKADGKVPAHFVGTVENHGKTPAVILWAALRYFVVHAGERPHISFRDDPSAPLRKGHVIFPGQVATIKAPGGIGSTASEIIKRGGSAHIGCAIAYKDAFGITRRTISHVVCDKVDGDRIDFHPFRRHNAAS